MREYYCQRGLSQIARLLTLQDRNPLSPTYGCFHRDFWLYKTSDFPDAVRQFGVHALALAYTNPFINNPFYGRAKIGEWTLAGLIYWSRIQHSDGSFDEFYPYERGWVGPSAFTTYTAVEAFKLIRDEVPNLQADRILSAIEKATRFIVQGEKEEDHLANHYAMAFLTVTKASELLEDPVLEASLDRLWSGFLGYHRREGWSMEYDGVDPGYLSATVSFLGKAYQSRPDSDILNVMKQSAEFCSYFVYPDGFYAGTIGSRNTQHFYPHGFEIIASQVPIAASVADRMLRSLGEGKLVPPEIMSDRYVFYRVPEFLLSYLDYKDRVGELPKLPYERDSFTEYFSESKLFIAKRPHAYLVANLAKGGVVKIFNPSEERLLLSDSGLQGCLRDGRVITSQWIDPSYQISWDADGWSVEGQFQVVPSHKLFNLVKNILFRLVLLLLGWSPQFSHVLKGKIRKIMVLGRRPVGILFRRSLFFHGDQIKLKDRIRLRDKSRLKRMMVGDDLFVRYVPQSRFFQSQELEMKARVLTQAELSSLEQNGEVQILQIVNPLTDCSHMIQVGSGEHGPDDFVGSHAEG